MPAYFVTNEFAEQLRNGDAYDESLEVGGFNVDGFDPLFDDDESLDYPEESTDGQDDTAAEQPSGHENPEDRLINLLAPMTADINSIFKDGEDILSVQGAGFADETNSSSRPQSSLPDEEHQAHGNSQESVGDQREASNSQEFARKNDTDGDGKQANSLPPIDHEHQLEPSANDASHFSQLQAGPTSGNQQLLPDPNDFGAHDPFSDDQLGDYLPNDQQPLQYTFDVFASPEWAEFARQDGNSDFAAFTDTGVQEEQSVDHQQAEQAEYTSHHNVAQGQDSTAYHSPYSHVNVGSPSNHAGPPVYTQHLSAFNTPAEEFVYDTLASTTEATYNTTPITSNPLGDVEQAFPGDMPIPSATVNAATNAPTHEDHQAIYDGTPDDSVEEVDAENDPDQVEFETYDEDDPSIQEDESKNGWGRTGKRNGQEVWFNKETSKWQLSASHHDMREMLIAKAQAEYPNDRYLYPDPTHGLPHGDTAFFKPHQNRGPDRSQCADELFVWREYASKKDENGKYIRKPKNENNWEHPGFMYEEGKILLDPNNNPVVDHKFIPLTLSVYTEAAKLQEMALHPGCRQIDLWARMPRWEMRNPKSNDFELISLRDKNTRINMPMTRFREKKGTIAGGDREGTEVIVAGLKKFYQNNGFDPVAAGNSVKSFPRDLKAWEAKEVRLGNTAQFGGRAGQRALDDEKRNEKLRKTKKAIENGKKKQADKGEGGASKRGLEADDSDSQESAPAPQKRRRGGQEVNTGQASWDQRYNGQQVVPNLEGGQNPYRMQDSLHGQNAGIRQPSLPRQPYSNPYSASEAPYQRPTLQAQSRLMQHPSGSSQVFPSGWNTRSLDYGMYMPAAMSPYGNTPAQARSNDNNPSSIYSPAGTYPPRSPASTGPQQTHHGRSLYAPVQRDHHNVMQNAPMSNVLPGYQFPAQTNSYSRGPPVQRQQPFQQTIPAPKSTGNTLGPGGRSMHHAPKKVLGKRGHQEVIEISDDEGLTHGSQQQQGNGQPAPGPDVGSLRKRQRNNETPGTEPRQQRHAHPERVPRPRYYGAAGAPVSLLPTNKYLGNTQPGSNFNSDINAPSSSLDGPFSEISDVFENQNHIATAQEVANQGMREPPSCHSQVPQQLSGGYEQQPNLNQAPQGGLTHLMPPQHMQMNGVPMNVSGTPQVAHAHGQTPQEAPLPAQAVQQVPFDIRNVRPADGQQSQSLHRALEYTRQAYREWTGEEPPVTNLEDCYYVQYRELRTAFRAWWISEKNPRRSDPSPKLWRMMAWNGWLEDWEAPENMERINGRLQGGFTH